MALNNSPCTVSAYPDFGTYVFQINFPVSEYSSAVIFCDFVLQLKNKRVTARDKNVLIVEKLGCKVAVEVNYCNANNRCAEN